MKHRQPPLLECDTLRYQRHHFPWHLHPNFYSFTLVVEGSADLIFTTGKYKAVKGDILFIPPNIPHQTIVDHSFTNLTIRLSSAAMGWGLFAHQEVYCIRGKDKELAFKGWFQELREKEDAVQRPLTSHRFSTIFEPCLQASERVPLETMAGMQEALLFMHQNFTEPIHLDQLSRRACVSTSHFQRIFKRQFSISPMRYLQSLRIDNAKALIKDGLSLTEVAHASGFYDQSHFHKYFKRLVGIIPKKYEALVQND